MPEAASSSRRVSVGRAGRRTWSWSALGSRDVQELVGVEQHVAQVGQRLLRRSAPGGMAGRGIARRHAGSSSSWLQVGFVRRRARGPARCETPARCAPAISRRRATADTRRANCSACSSTNSSLSIVSDCNTTADCCAVRAIRRHRRLVEDVQHRQVVVAPRQHVQAAPRMRAAARQSLVLQ